MQLLWLFELDGVVAQLVERLVRNEKVAGSIPVGSTIFLFPFLQRKRRAYAARLCKLSR